MTPGARIQAAIELVDQIEQAIAAGGAPADALVARYGRERRYIGAKDRDAINRLVYDVLRHRALLRWRLGQVGAEPAPRALVLAALVSDGSFSPAVFGDGAYAPPPPDRAEQGWIAALGQVDDAQAPRDVRLEVPAWLLDRLDRRLGDAVEAELQALAGRASVDVRVNTLKATPDKVRDGLAQDGIAVEPVPLAPLALRHCGHRRLTGTSVFKRGWIDVQDAGSQLAAALVDARPGQQLCDLCAGAGGKTLALAAAMANRGQIHAFDIDGRRLRELAKRGQRAGVRNVQAAQLPRQGARRAQRLAPLAGRMDRVLLDVPCSASGTWRRHPDLKWRLSPDRLSTYAATQRDLLAEGAELVRPDGRLIYVTCSLLADENEVQIETFLSNCPGWHVVEAADIAAQVGLPRLSGGRALMPGAVQLTLAEHGTDAFFVAVLERSTGN